VTKNEFTHMYALCWVKPTTKLVNPHILFSERCLTFSDGDPRRLLAPSLILTSFTAPVWQFTAVVASTWTHGLLGLWFLHLHLSSLLTLCNIFHHTTGEISHRQASIRLSSPAHLIENPNCISSLSRKGGESGGGERWLDVCVVLVVSACVCAKLISS